jgi:hypothetical protein
MGMQIDVNDLVSALKVVQSQKGGVGYKHDLSTPISPTTNLLHGPSGLFGQAGIEPQVFSTRVRPTGLSSVLPARASNDTNPIVPYITGFTDDEVGTEKNRVCDDPLEAGAIKNCFQGALFGRIERSTQTLEITALGQRVNRGEYTDLSIVNDPFGEGDFGSPSTSRSFEDILQSEVNARLSMVGIAFQNVIGAMNWTGTPNNNTALGGYKEYFGLESLVTAVHKDVITNVNCPSLASDVKNFNYKSVENNSAELFTVLTMIYRFVKHNARTMGFDPVTWVFVMRSDLFQQLTDFWPLVYASYRGAGSAGNPNNTDALVLRQMSIDMQNGNYLKIDNVNVPVVLDDYITEWTNTTNNKVPNAAFASDIYLLPLQVRGNLQVLFYEYFNFDGPNGAMQAVRDGRLGTEVYTTDGGRFIWTTQHTNWCFAWISQIQPRLRLLAPQLAGRLQNVVYAPLQHFRQPVPTDPYFVNGGNTTASALFTPYDKTDF